MNDMTLMITFANFISKHILHAWVAVSRAVTFFWQGNVVVDFQESHSEKVVADEAWKLPVWFARHLPSSADKFTWSNSNEKCFEK